MTDDDGIDWSLTTWDGHRRRQDDAFRGLSFREKVEALERMSEVAALFASIRAAAIPGSDPRAEDRPTP